MNGLFSKRVFLLLKVVDLQPNQANYNIFACAAVHVEVILVNRRPLYYKTCT